MPGKAVTIVAGLGWFGKIPPLGDFASRRLPQDFVDAWDLWLQHGMAASRASLGARWLDRYLTSPIWYFSLFPGVMGEQAWTGLLMPSVDKVGRHFPLTIAAPLDSGEAVVGMFAQQAWYARLGAIALSTLSLDFPAGQLESDLDQLPFPANDLACCGEAGRRLADWWLGDSPETTCALAEEGAGGGALADVGQCLLATTGRGRSLWWHHSQESRPRLVHGFRGLPPAERFEGLLDGD